MYIWKDVIKNYKIYNGCRITELPSNGKIVAIQVTGLTMKQEIELVLDEYISLFRMPATIQGGFFFLGFDARQYKMVQLKIHTKETRRKVGIRVLMEEH